MSYDFYIAVDTGGVEPHYIDHPSNNYTSNVSGIWSKCLTAALRYVPEAQKWCGDDDRRMRERYPDHEYYGGLTPRDDELVLRDLDGKSAGELLDLLRAAVKWGEANIYELRDMNPPNGWGDADGAVEYLGTIKAMCAEHPKGTLEISS